MPVSNGTNTSPSLSSNPPLSLHHFVAVLCRHKWLGLAVFSTVALAVLAGTLLMPKQYESRMKILVKNARADSVVSPDATGAQIRGDVSEAQVNSEIALLTSTELLEHVVRACGLDRRQRSSNPAEAVERAVRRLRRDLEITPVRKASIIEITYASDSPELSPSVLRNLTDRFLESHLRVHRTPGTFEFFRRQAVTYQTQLSQAETELSAFRRRNNFVLIAEQKDLVLRRVIDTEASLHEAEASLAETVRRVAELHRQLATLDPRIVTQSRVIPNQYSVERLNTMLADLKNRKSQLLMKFRGDDRMVAEINEEIANTQAALDRAAGMNAVEQTTDVNPLRQRLEGELAAAELARAGLESRRASLRSVAGSYRGRLLQLEDATAGHDALERALKEAQDKYTLYARKQEEARIADSLDEQKIANVAVAEAPVTSHLPSKPNVPLNLALGVLLAGFLSLGAAFGADWTDDSLHSPEQFESATGLPVLATVPLKRV